MKLLIFAGLTILFYSNASRASNNRMTWTTEAQLYSPSQSITSFTDDWDELLDSGNLAFAHAKTAFQYARHDIRYGLQWRYDYNLYFHPESAHVYWSYKNNVLPNERPYRIDITANHNERVGFSIGKVWSVPYLAFHEDGLGTFSATINLWKGLAFVDGKFQGDLTTKNVAGKPTPKLIDTLQTANAALDYRYDTPALKEDKLAWYPEKPHGLGASLDIQTDIKLTPNWYIGLGIFDILGYMQWDNAPQTTYRLRYHIATRPVYDLPGQLSQVPSHTQKLPWHAQGYAEYQQSGYGMRLNTMVHAKNDLHQLHFFTEKNKHRIAFIAEPQTKSIGLLYQHKTAGIKYLTDSLNTNKAKRFDLMLYANFLW